MYYKASLGNSAKIITAIVGTIFIASMLPGILISRNGNDVIPYGIALLCISVLVFTKGYSTSGYEINDGMLKIKRPFGAKIFDMQQFKMAEKIATKEIRYSFRTFGNGGLFGYYGKFWNKKFGSMTWCATNLKNAVLIRLNDGRKIIVTPDDPELFLAAIRSKL